LRFLVRLVWNRHVQGFLRNVLDASDSAKLAELFRTWTGLSMLYVSTRLACDQRGRRPLRARLRRHAAISVKKKRKLFQRPNTSSPCHVLLPRCRFLGPKLIKRILTFLPFSLRAIGPSSRRLLSPFGMRLGSNNPKENAFTLEPFSTSVFNVSI